MSESGAALDELDREILKFLLRDGRTPYTMIASELGVAEGTVRKRVARMIENGIVKVAAVVDPSRLGMNFIAIVGIKVSGDDPEGTIEALGRLPEVRYIAVCTGSHDLIAEVTVKSNEDLFYFLTRKLRRIPGVVSSDTSLVLKICKQSYTWSGGLGLEGEAQRNES
ncbi:MAG TPA: Lrp/AsnC family transcriptional regulator [Firmicutes bacterium]|nr:Lrp/AsnC family transcriptional regulator [Bacillota bacterium]HHY98060.1 Lrp/AsnC family transcriptional regulator [Bacillota bacterium]